MREKKGFSRRFSAGVLFLLCAICAICGSALGQTVSPGNLDFGATLIGTSAATQAVTLTNNTASTISSISVSVTTDSAEYSVVTSPATNCGGSLAAAATCTVTVTFTPTGAGARPGVVTVSWTGTAYSPIYLYLQGFGSAGAGLPGNTGVIANASATGTTLYSVAKLTGAPSTAVIAATSDNKSGAVLGIVTAGAGTSGYATVQSSGQTYCNFDGSTTAGDFVLVSTGTAGDCTDSASTLPGDGSQVLGRVLSTNSGAGLYPIMLSIVNISGGTNTAATSAAFTSAPTPSAAAGVTLGTALLPYSSLYFGNAAADSSQLTGTFTGHRTFTFPDASITVPGTILTDCGSSKSCAAPTTRSSTMKVAIGTGAAVAGSLALTGISPAFTSTSSYTCTAADPSNAYTMTFVNGSGSATTGTASTSDTDTWSWVCIGY